jgi:hypothetical protein
MDEKLFKQKLKDLRDQYPQASFAWIWAKALSYFEPQSKPHSEQLGQSSSFSEHFLHFEGNAGS